MKKLYLYAAATLALGLGLTSCDQEHNDLRLEPPTNYILEAPEGADQLMVFGASGSNVDNVLKVNSINPYNVTTTVDFQVQVARSEEDFLKWDSLVAEQIANGNDDGNYDFTNADNLPYTVLVSGIYLNPVFDLPGADFCDAVNTLYGYESENEIPESVPVAFRVHAWIPGVEYSSIFSNIVDLKVKSYIPLRDPRKLYFVGKAQGWSMDDDSWFALETGVGTNIYKGKFNIPANQFIFRFYSELGDWDANSIGAVEGYTEDDDHPIDIEFEEDVYSGPIYNGKGSWQDPTWEGGSIDVTLDLNDNAIEIIAHPGEESEPEAIKAIYLIGAPQGWDINSGDMAAMETSDGSKIYKGVFVIPEGQFQFRFYSKLGDWDSNSLGSLESGADEDVEITLPFDGDIYAGKGKWKDPNWEGGAIQVTIDLNKNTISIIEFNELRKIYIIGDCQGWDINSDAMYVEETAVGSNIYTNSVAIDAGKFLFRFYTELGDWENNSLGSLESGADENEDITVPFEGQVYHGKGKWNDPSWAGGEVDITLNLKEMTVSFK